ncbi:PAS domain S-box protein [Pseudomonas akapageensis]|uniref:PAS domain S-box protein n=1 Tax=Pseudomonas akapageensis TaxID=2609961 RepID=UPI00140B0C11|nr:PAS domain S-box protein [Pseudomonas akapageensis]
MRVPRVTTYIRKGSRPELLIWSGCLALIVLVAGLGNWTLWRDFQDRQSTASMRTRILAAAVAGYTTTALQQRRLSMDVLARHLSALPWPLDDGQTREELERFVDADPQRNPLLVIAAGQRWSLPDLPGGELERLPVQRVGPSIWFADRLQLNGKSWLPVFRRYRHPDGEWFTVGALVPLEAVQGFIESLGLPSNLPITLLDFQGRIYVQRGPVPQQALAPDDDGLLRLEGEGVRGTLLARKSVPDYPLQVVVARWPDEYLASWYQQKRLTLIAVLVSILVILGLAAGMASSWRLLARSERRYRQLFQSINDGVLLVGRSGVLEANARAAELFGVSSGACLEKQKLLDLCMPYQADNRPARHWLAQLQVEVERGSELFTTLKFKRLDSSGEFECEVHLSPIRLGRTVYLLVCMHDISARRKAEDELQVSRQKLLEAQLIAGLGVWSWEAGAGHVIWTDGCARIFGMPADVSEFSLNDFIESIVVEERADAIEAFQQALRGERLDIELHIRRPDGDLRNVQFCGVLRQHDGNPQLLGAMHDVTAQKRVERRLSERERHSRELVEMLPEGLLIHRNKKVIFANAAAAKLFAAESASQLVGLDIFDLIDASSTEQAKSEIELILGPDYTPVFLPRRYRRLDGTCFDVEMAAQRLFINGQVCAQVVIRDVTEQRLLQHDLEAANDRLQRLSRQIIEVQERERHHLARELHDDVGQLLTFIKISAAGVQRHLDGEQEQRQAALVRIADEALSKVRDLSRMLRPAQLDGLGLVAAMRWQVENFLPQLPDGVSCRLYLAELEPRPDPCLEISLFRIFQEALSNVLKHANASLVEVHLERRDGKVELSIRDNGQGFDATAALQSGKGMGLMGMAERARLAGGEFRLNSSQGSGTQIGVGIPEHNNSEMG